MNSKTWVYVGPTIENIVLSGTAFCGGLPTKLKDTVNKMPYLSELIVPVEQLSKTRKELKQKESRLEVLYRRAEKGGL